MTKKGKKIMTFVLLISLLVLSGNLTAQIRKGIGLVIQKTDGQEVRGELVTVKRDSLLLLELETEEDITVNLNVIDVITVDNKSLAFELGVGAFIAAAATRLALHSALERDIAEDEATAHQVQSVWLWGAIGGGVGVLAGSFFGLNKTIRIQGESEADIQNAMEKLSKKARVRGIQ